MSTNSSVMTANDWLLGATRKLAAADIATARLDALVLLADELSQNQAQVLAAPDLELSAGSKKRLDNLIKLRVAHQPLAYVRGRTEFYGREFMITPAVLEPRPESETMIELLKTLPAADRQNIVDVGTGSGALAITAALELPGTEVIAIDIDPACLKVAQQNAAKHQVAVKFVTNNLIKKLDLPSGGCVILANLPYVPDDHRLNQAAMNEPKLAIFGGPDGLDLYRQMFEQIGQLSNQPQTILTEALPFQHTALAQIAAQQNYQLIKTEDFIQLFTS